MRVAERLRLLKISIICFIAYILCSWEHPLVTVFSKERYVAENYDYKSLDTVTYQMLIKFIP